MSEIPSEKLKNLNDFVNHLKEFYGRDIMQLRTILNSLQQRKTEQPQAFLQRVISAYYRSKGVEPKKMSQITKTIGTGDDERLVYPNEVSDLTYHFVNGLFDKRVKSHIKLDLAGFKLKNAAKKTMEIQRAFNDLPDNQINDQKANIKSIDKVDETNSEDKIKVAEIVKQVMMVERKKRNRYEKRSSSYKNQASKYCNYCKIQGHNY